MIKGMMTVGNSKNVERYNVKMLIGVSGQFLGFSRNDLDIGALRPDVAAIQECYLVFGNHGMKITVSQPITFNKLTVSFDTQTFEIKKDNLNGDTFWGDCGDLIMRDFLNSAGQEIDVTFEFE